MLIFLATGKGMPSAPACCLGLLACGFWAGRKLSSTSYKEPPVSKVTYTSQYKIKKSYGFWKFIGDCFMTMITGGLWLIWIFVREMRGR